MTTAANPTTTELSAETRALAAQFLGREAQLLDEGRERDWFELLDDEILYTIPIRQATDPRSKEVDRTAFRVRDTKTHILTRIQRLETGIAYSEVPPSRTMRLVGSIYASPTDRPEVIAVSSSLLLYRQRGIDTHFDLIPCRRNDELRLVDGEMRLLSREVILTEVSVNTPNLGLFL